MKITSISFDFWNTIYKDHQHSYERHNERVKCLQDALVKNGYAEYSDTSAGFNTSSSLSIEGSFKYCWEYFDKIWKNEHRTLNARELLRIGLDYLKADLPPDEFSKVADFFGNILLKYPPELFDGVKDVLHELSGKYKLGITSDTAYTGGAMLKKLLEKDGILGYFSGFTYSDEIGCSKPDPRMFRNTMKQLGSVAHETIHVGDNEYTDIQGAKEEGLKAILFTGGLKDKNVDTEADYRVDSWEEFPEVMKFV